MGKGSAKEKKEGETEESMTSGLLMPFLISFRLRNWGSYHVGEGPGNYFCPRSLLMSLPQRNSQTCLPTESSWVSN